MLARLRYVPPLEAKDFLRDYSDSRFGRLLLYLLAYGIAKTGTTQTCELALKARI